MTTARLAVEAKLPKPAFSLKEEIPLSLVLNNTSDLPVTVPDPFSGADAAVSLDLRSPNGAARTLRLCDVGPGPGVPEHLVRARILPGRPEIFTLDVAERFELTEVGAYVLVVTCTWAEGDTWRSSELHFSIRPSSGGYLDVVPSETAATGYHAVLWTEPDEDHDRLLLFGGGPQGPRLFGARSVLSVPRDAQPAVSTAMAGLPQTDRWVAWLTDGSLDCAFLSEEDGGAIPPRAEVFPAGTVAPRIIRPLLAQHAPDEPGPGALVGVLAGSAAGGSELRVARVFRERAARWSQPVVLPEFVVGAWATFASAQAGLIVVAIGGPGTIRVMGIGVLWDGSTGEPSDLFTVPADRLLLGDTRADLQDRTWIGLLVARGSTWARARFTLPAGDPEDAGCADEWLPGEGAVPVRARLDGAGRLHLLYRQDGRLFYLPPGTADPTWSSESLGARASAEHLVLRPHQSPLLVYRDSVEGVAVARIDSPVPPDVGRASRMR